MKLAGYFIDGRTAWGVIENNIAYDTSAVLTDLPDLRSVMAANARERVTAAMSSAPTHPGERCN